MQEFGALWQAHRTEPGVGVFPGPSQDVRWVTFYFSAQASLLDTCPLRTFPLASGTRSGLGLGLSLTRVSCRYRKTIRSLRA
jgi:hypothetical protein